MSSEARIVSALESETDRATAGAAEVSMPIAAVSVSTSEQNLDLQRYGHERALAIFPEFALWADALPKVKPLVLSSSECLTYVN